VYWSFVRRDRNPLPLVAPWITQQLHQVIRGGTIMVRSLRW